MNGYLTKAQHYRDRAAQTRNLANKEPDNPARKALIELAEAYEGLHDKFLVAAGSCEKLVGGDGLEPPTLSV